MNRIRSASAAAAALAVTGLVAAAPATAATARGNADPVGSGYVAKGFHSAQVTLRIPRISCSANSPKRGVRLGIFGTYTRPRHPAPIGVSLSVRVNCAAGKAHYEVVYRNGLDPSTERDAPGNVVRLILHGTSSFEVDDLSNGGVSYGGGYSSPGHNAPTIGTEVLIGARPVGDALHGVRADFRHAKVNHSGLGTLGHQRQGRTGSVHVGALGADDHFQVTLV